MGRLLSSVSIVILGLFMLIRPEDIPPRYNPFTPVMLDTTPNFVWRWKIRTRGLGGPECLPRLAKSQARAEVLPDMLESDVCHILDRVRLTGLSRARLAPVETRCSTAARLYLWEKLALQPAARRLLGADVAEVRHYSSYSCRGIRTSRGVSTRMSQHATANAFDISGFVLTDGRRITLKSDWTGDGPEAKFLRAAHQGLCEWFNTVLGPDYNALHADHFHADMGRWISCR